MAQSGLKQVFLALLLLVFLNQWTVASTMHCISPGQDPHAAHALAENTHHAHDEPMAIDLVSSETVFDCCKAVNHCLSGGCLLPLMALDVLMTASPVPPLTIASLYETTTPPSPISSLYRPPIFR
ncbi:MAG TPA: hypothetical protein VIV27_08815 [Halioglobus sp.]